MLRRAEVQRRRTQVEIEFLDLPGESIPLRDASVDTIVSTFTLCTIPGVVEAIQGVRRLLNPAGKLIFFEHGRSPDPPVALAGAIGTAVSLGIRRLPRDRDIPSRIRKGGFNIEQMDAGYLAPFPKSGSYCWWGVGDPELRKLRTLATQFTPGLQAIRNSALRATSDPNALRREYFRRGQTDTIFASSACGAASQALHRRRLCAHRRL